MRRHFISIPVFDGGVAEGELNRFLASHRVLAVDRQLVADGTRSAWAVCVSYIEGGGGAAGDMGGEGGKKKSVDYREALPPEEFEVFARLRTLRKEMAEKDGVPAYALVTNEQLAAMVRERVQTAGALAKLDGGVR